MMRQEHKNHFLYLDGMRGVAAILIGLMHESQILSPDTGYHLPNGYLAVDFFFCLSGFVIAYNYSDKIGVSASRREFLLARVIRLYPLMLFGILEGAPILLMGALRKDSYAVEIAVLTSVTSLVLLPAGLLFGRSCFPPNGPLWSLFFEFAAYLSYSLFTIKTKKNLLISILALAVFLVITVALFQNLHLLGFYTPYKFWGGFARVGYPFAAGVLIYRFGLYRNRKAWLSCLAFAAMPIVLVTPWSTWGSDLVIVILFLPMLVMAGTAPASARIAPYLKLLGEISFPFYLVHEPILRALRTVPAIERLVTVYPLRMMAVITLGFVLFALAVSRVYDIPVRRWLNNLAASRKAKAPQTHAAAVSVLTRVP